MAYSRPGRGCYIEMKKFFRSAVLLLCVCLLTQGLCIASTVVPEVSRLTFAYPDDDSIRIDLTTSLPVSAYTITKGLDRTTIDLPGVTSRLYPAYTVRNTFDVQVETSALDIGGASALRLTVIAPRTTIIEKVNDPAKLSFLVRRSTSTSAVKTPTASLKPSSPPSTGGAQILPVRAIVPARSNTPERRATEASRSVDTRGDKGAIRGEVRDERGAVIVGAEVAIMTSNKLVRSARSNEAGGYSFSELPPGKYTVVVRAPNFAEYVSQSIDVGRASNVPLNVLLTVNEIRPEVVTIAQNGGLSADLDNNARGVTLRPDDLGRMPDDPRAFSTALLALAAASGSTGGEIVVDGFAGGRIPPKKAIKEIRISKNTFSAEYGRPGNGRIEIITKPGMEDFSGGGYFGFNTRRFNTRDPFAALPLPYHSRDYGLYFGGPVIPKRVSFFSSLDRASSNSLASVEARILDSGLNVVPVRSSFSSPLGSMNLTSRVDIQLDPRNTFITKYLYARSSGRNAGIGGTSLADRAYNTLSSEHTLQFSETAILSPSVVLETRSQYVRRETRDAGVGAGLVIDVPGAFTTGSAFSNLRSVRDRLDFHSVTTGTFGNHTLRGGAGLRYVDLLDAGDRGFGGTYLFEGGIAPKIDLIGRVVLDPTGKPVMETITGLERYRRTLLLSRLGMSTPDIRVLGGGASQFSLVSGKTSFGLNQTSLYGFLQDEWRLRPNLMIGLGVRFEGQNNVPSGRVLAPRVSFAWSKNGKKNGKASDRPTVVVRGGTGLFYEPFGEDLALQAMRSGAGQQRYIATDPATLNAFPAIPTEQALRSAAVPVSTITSDPRLRLPMMWQSNIGVEKELPGKVVLSATYTNLRAFRSFRSRLVDPVTKRFQYESKGRFTQNQLALTVSRRLSKASVYATYNLSKATDDTDGPSFVPLTVSGRMLDRGRSSSDVRHTVYVGGWLRAFGFDVSPTVVYRSGIPFNITVGRDLNGDTILNDRPAFATDLLRPSVVATQFGVFDTDPIAGQQIVPRNYGTSPNFVSVNLNLSRTITLGGDSSVNGKRGRAFGIQMPQRPMYLTFSLQVENLFNRANPYVPEGNLSSPLFGRSYTSAGAYGFGSYQPGNRVIKPYITFSF